VPVRALVWDMDGTLLDSSEAVTAAFAAALARIGGPVVAAAEVVSAYSLGPPEAILAHLAGRPLSTADTEEYYRELEVVRVSAYPGIAGVLRALRERGQPVAVSTGASSRAARMLLAAAGLAVDILVGGDEVARPKPAADGLLRTAALLGVSPRECAYIGDAPADMGAARAAGCHSAAAAWGHMFDAGQPCDSVVNTPADALLLLE
jgi:HAD superfamily hydrolase (TIGR01509 family)